MENVILFIIGAASFGLGQLIFWGGVHLYEKLRS